MRYKKERFAAVYIRVSTNQQSHQSQIPDLKRYVEAHRDSLGNVKVFTEKFTGRTMDRRKWSKIYKAIEQHLVTHLIVWRLDRLGRTASGLTKLFETLNQHHVQFVSVKEGIDLSTSAGRLIANVLASVAAYETEVRAERVKAGQEAARASGKTWGGSKKGRLHKTTIEQVRQIVAMKEGGEKVAHISRTVGVDRPGVYRILRRVADGDIEI